MLTESVSTQSLFCFVGFIIGEFEAQLSKRLPFRLKGAPTGMIEWLWGTLLVLSGRNTPRDRLLGKFEIYFNICEYPCIPAPAGNTANLRFNSLPAVRFSWQGRIVLWGS
jgi:hypothetical protein